MRRTFSVVSRVKERSPHRWHTVDGTPPTRTQRPSTLKTSSTVSIRPSFALQTLQAMRSNTSTFSSCSPAILRCPARRTNNPELRGVGDGCLDMKRPPRFGEAQYQPRRPVPSTSSARLVMAVVWMSRDWRPLRNPLLRGGCAVARRSREDGDPSSPPWIPACARMTVMQGASRAGMAVMQGFPVREAAVGPHPAPCFDCTQVSAKTSPHSAPAPAPVTLPPPGQSRLLSDCVGCIIAAAAGVDADRGPPPRDATGARRGLGPRPAAALLSLQFR